MWLTEFDAVLRSWLRTPYAPGQALRDTGVDCRYFVVRVLDELHGLDAPLPERIHRFTPSFSDCQIPMAELASRYPSIRVSDPGPGDAVVVRSRQSLAHVGLIGLQGELWHADTAVGVCFTGLSQFTLRVAWRFTQRESWSSTTSRRSLDTRSSSARSSAPL